MIYAEIATGVLDELHRRFVEGKNPIYAWRAYHLARHAQVPVPDWVLDYLDTCAAGLHEGQSPADALGLATAGGPSKFRQAEMVGRDAGIVSRVDVLRQLEPGDVADPPEIPAPKLRGDDSPLEIIMHRVANEAGLSFKTVSHIYYSKR